MHTRKLGLLLMLVGLFVSACAAAAPATPSGPVVTPTLCPTPLGAKAEVCAVNPGATAQSTTAALGQVGPVQAGAPTPAVEVKALNLDKPGESLVFQVSVPSNVVVLHMSVLTNDNGLAVRPSAWKPVSGTGTAQVVGELSFPVGKLLVGAKSITLTIQGGEGGADRKFSFPVAH